MLLTSFLHDLGPLPRPPYTIVDVSSGVKVKVTRAICDVAFWRVSDSRNVIVDVEPKSFHGGNFEKMELTPRNSPPENILL